MIFKYALLEEEIRFCRLKRLIIDWKNIFSIFFLNSKIRSNSQSKPHLFDISILIQEQNHICYYISKKYSSILLLFYVF